MMRQPAIFPKLFLLLAFISSACSLSNTLGTQAAVNGQTPRDQTLYLGGGESTNPRDYDPATAVSSGGDLNRIFSGLVSFNRQMQLNPEIAESWAVSADGTVYTFKLRSNAQFQDGKKLTAADFVYSWDRAADPKTRSNTVLTYLGDIVGVKQMRSGQAGHISGLKALDEHTLQVTIDAPKAYFLYKLTYPTAYVLDQANVESGQDWYRRPNGSGPYQLKEWQSFKYQLFERSSHFYLDQPAIRYIYVKLDSSGLLSYENNQIDITYIGANNLERILDPKEPLHADLHMGVDMCTDYVTFEANQPPFDDLKVRQAFSMAFDRHKYINVVLGGAALPAEGLFPPAMPGYNPNLVSLPYDPARARQLLAESRYGGPAGLPPITYTQSGVGYYVGSNTAALIQMWQQNLGVTINVESIDSNKYYDELNAGRHGQIINTGWCADYPDPENFADVLFHSAAENNQGHYSSPALDQLLEEARLETDVNKRIALYQQAEQMIVNDAPVLFITHSLSYQLVKPYIKGYVLTPVSIPIERYLSIDASLLPK